MKSTQTLLLFMLSFTLAAQTSPFRAGVTAGINLTQVDGDKQFGYQKKGLNLGLKGGIVFHDNWEVTTELIYNLKGAVPSKEEKNLNKRLIDIDLHYAEIPVLLKFSFLPSTEGYYKWHVFGGFSYGRLLQSNVNVQKNDLSIDTTELNIINQLGFKSSDVNVIIGAVRYFSPRLGLSVRHTVSLTPYYNNPNPMAATNQMPEGYKTFRNYFLSINLVYDFVAPKMSMKKKKETPL